MYVIAIRKKGRDGFSDRVRYQGCIFKVVYVTMKVSNSGIEDTSDDNVAVKLVLQTSSCRKNLIKEVSFTSSITASMCIDSHYDNCFCVGWCKSNGNCTVLNFRWQRYYFTYTNQGVISNRNSGARVTISSYAMFPSFSKVELVKLSSCFFSEFCFCYYIIISVMKIT